MNITLLKGFNNYFNRKIIKFDNYTDYTDSYIYKQIANLDFNPNDGVDAMQTFNWSEEWTPDYILVTEQTGSGSQTATVIKSRWFVTEWTRTRGKQYNATLRRDVISDNLDYLIDAPCYIEKATIQLKDDVAIYNQEDMSFNEIKKEETLLKDKSGIPWIVGYYSKINADKTFTIPSVYFQVSGTYNSLSEFYNSLDGWNGSDPYEVVKQISYTIYMELIPAFYINDTGYITSAGQANVGNSGSGGYPSITNFALKDVPTGREKRVNYLTDVSRYVANKQNDIRQNYHTINSSRYHIQTPAITNGSIILVAGNGNDVPDKFYKINIRMDTRSSYKQNVSANDSTYLYIKNLIRNKYSFTDKSGYSTNSEIIEYFDRYTITLEEIRDGESFSITIPANASDLQDSPYNMIAIPANIFNYTKNGSTNIRSSLDSLNAMSIMQKIQKDIGEAQSQMYDAQLLPFCPIFKSLKWVNLGAADGVSLDLSELNIDPSHPIDYAPIKRGNTEVAVALFPNRSTFSFDINTNLTLPEDISDLKVVNQCDKYRLCSPNMASMFDFNLVKTGDITKINVDCTYKPFNPYIHINPVWGRLYGTDFDDYRGLICKGDFSITSTTDAWVQYQTANKNYLNAFNQKVETMEVNNKVAREKELFKESVGIIGGAVAGAKTGSKVAGGTGALAGTLIGAGIGVVTGEQNRNWNEEIRQAEMANTISQFNYSLDNIRAIPDTLANVTTFDANNRLFPILEYYTCTEQEKDLFKEKMRYNGMTIMRIATIAQFLSETPTFIKGQLIRIDELSEDSHMFSAIYEELKKGIYI